MIGTYLQSKNKLNKVNFDAPDYVILIHVICNMCFISFVKNFFQYKKYNLVEQGNKFNENKNIQSNLKKPKAIHEEKSERDTSDENNHDEDDDADDDDDDEEEAEEEGEKQVDEEKEEIKKSNTKVTHVC
jgi:hypothetical protein